MSAYCALMAEGLHLDGVLMRTASRLHDVGNLGVPDAIVLKPGAFTAEEREIVQQHAARGHELLAGSGIELLEVAATIAWTHHERVDGSGYPRGLRGEMIPLEGRIAAVADVFDALTTDRTYRPTMRFEEAVALLERERGRLFDPLVLDRFVTEPDAVRAIMSEHEGTPAEPPPAVPVPAHATLREAAMTLGVSTSRLRRWADAGRIESVRTIGGHRRFPLAAVRRLAAERRPPPVVRRVTAPTQPLPTLARILERNGADLSANAAAALYRTGATGWFAHEHAQAASAEWAAALALASGSGHYEAALDASRVFLRGAYLQATGLLERFTYLEHFGRGALHALTNAGAPRDELRSARQLFVALQHAHLDDR